jgi:glutamate synthase (NADPH/NADH) large chain
MQNNNNSLSKDHSACGVGMLVYKNSHHRSHELVQLGLHALAANAYRAGFNHVTGESDGAGIKLTGLSSAFFSQAFGQKLEPVAWVLGSFFMAPDQIETTQALIERELATHEFSLVGWREIPTNDALLTERALAKKPAMWQAAWTLKEIVPFSLTPTLLGLNLSLLKSAKSQNLSLHIVSLSHEHVVYKGMLRPEEVGAYFSDLQDPSFTARAIEFHARFATNTDPQWANAQPCLIWSHNGELNSAYANAREMRAEGLDVDVRLSDSMQFGQDLAHTLIKHQLSLAEAFVRLMPPSPIYSQPMNHFIEANQRLRTPYNGPAFGVASLNGEFLVKLDDFGLRPSHLSWYRDEREEDVFYAGSDQLTSPASWQLISNQHLEPGGMCLIKADGRYLTTEAIIHEAMSQAVIAPERGDLLDLSDEKLHLDILEATMPQLELNPILYASGWRMEDCFVLEETIAKGMEKVAAMGDDTDPLHERMPPHLSYFFHQLFAQVSAPSLDSIKERSRFYLDTYLGQSLRLASPILSSYLLQVIEARSILLDITFDVPQEDQDVEAALLRALEQLSWQVNQALTSSSPVIFVLTDRHRGAARMAMPDLMAVALVSQLIERLRCDQRASIVVDSYQVMGPHQYASLLAMGAHAVYARGVFAQLSSDSQAPHQAHQYRHAIEKSLLKTMGKMGITHIRNYTNGRLMGLVGLDVREDVSLSSLFGGLYSPVRGYQLKHIALALYEAHQRSFGSEAEHFYLIPRSGKSMPVKEGMKHGFGPVVVHAFHTWMEQEKHRENLYRLHQLLIQRGHEPLLQTLADWEAGAGFLDRHRKQEGFYPKDYLETLQPSALFIAMMRQIDDFRHRHPTSIKDRFRLPTSEQLRDLCPIDLHPLMSQAEIRQMIFSGNMSQGALTVGDPFSQRQLGAHEHLTQGLNAVGAMSAAGEGGESHHGLRHALSSSRSKQIASGRFGVSAMQIIKANEIEIKIVQGAKPGEGGQLPGSKVTIRIAAQRGGLPGIDLVSPPPHHDIYSIEDLEQLIHDVKSVNPRVNVSVKLAASQGISTIAIGVAKAGADVINIAGASGGTGAAAYTSIHHTGFPAEIGLAEVHRALIASGLRNLVKLRISGGFKTAEEFILAILLGADLVEMGTAFMLTLGCRMQRTCNKSCQPGVANDGHLYQGDSINVERYVVLLTASVQQWLLSMGLASLHVLRGRLDLLNTAAFNAMNVPYDTSLWTEPYRAPSIPESWIQRALQARTLGLKRTQEDDLIVIIEQFFAEHPDGTYISDPHKLTTQDRSFGARIAGHFAEFLEQNPNASIHLHTYGHAGQSYGFVLPRGMLLTHTGTVESGAGKSMSGGRLVIRLPETLSSANTVAGNALLYGASGGQIHVQGAAGHRVGILLKGAEVVVEDVGALAFEFMTSGTALILGSSGHSLGVGMSGGILFNYNPSRQSIGSESLRAATSQECNEYADAIRRMLERHVQLTHSPRAEQILKHFSLDDFQVLIPLAMDRIQTLEELDAVMKTYALSQAPLTAGMEVWLEQKKRSLSHSTASISTTKSFRDIEDLNSPSPRTVVPIKKRLTTVSGALDEQILEPIEHIAQYASQLLVDSQGCSGCHAHACSNGHESDHGCPSGKDIHLLNKELQKLGPIRDQQLTERQWQVLRYAFEIQIQESPFIAYTGAACPAPCEDACTEGIPEKIFDRHDRGNKPIGDPVHIKDIEYSLFLVGRALKWFTQPAFGFLPPFQTPIRGRRSASSHKELIIVGSGPAGMTLAYEALKAGLTVRMYEKSRVPGGLLMNGIPAHKFSKEWVYEDFESLKAMGLQLYLGSEVFYRNGDFYSRMADSSEEVIVASKNHPHQHIALCLGGGAARTLPKAITRQLAPHQFIQAIDFLEAANAISRHLKEDSSADLDALIEQHFGQYDPRGKHIAVIGGGDTAQDAIRWIARYFNQRGGQLLSLVRGPKPNPECLTKENQLRDAEVEYIAGSIEHQVDIVAVEPQNNGKITVHVKKTMIRQYEAIEAHSDTRTLFASLPREYRVLGEHQNVAFKDVDLLISALGYQDPSSMPLLRDTQFEDFTNLSVAGDASRAKPMMIVGAQANAKDTWVKKIRPLLCERSAEPGQNSQTFFSRPQTSEPMPSSGVEKASCAQ